MCLVYSVHPTICKVVLSVCSYTTRTTVTVCVFILCSYDLASQKQTYRELPHVLVHERSKRLPRRWRKFIESKRKESLVDGSDIDLSFRTGDEEDTRPDIIGEGELSASEGEALLKASRYE